MQKNREKEKKERELAIQKQRREQRKKEQKEAKLEIEKQQKQIKQVKKIDNSTDHVFKMDLSFTSCKLV